MKALPWLLVLALLVALYAMRGIADYRGSALEQARDSVAALQPRVDSLRAEALRGDTALRIVTDTIVRTIERVRVVQAESADSVRVRTDSVGAYYLDNLIAAQADEVAAVWAVADERLAWGSGWRDYALTLEQQNVQLQIANTLAYGLLRAQRRQNLALRAGAIVLAGAVLYGAVK